MLVDLNEEDLLKLKMLLLENDDSELLNKLEPTMTITDIIVDMHNDVYVDLEEHLHWNLNDFEIQDFYTIKDSISKLQNLLNDYDEVINFAQSQLYPHYDKDCNLKWVNRNTTIH